MSPAQTGHVRTRRDFAPPTDPLYSSGQWYLQDAPSDASTMRLHQYDAWSRGYTGAGVVVCVVDDGLEHTNPELSSNYLPEASYDYNGAI